MGVPKTEWIIAAGALLLPIIAFLLLEGSAYHRRRRERALAHRSKQRDPIAR